MMQILVKRIFGVKDFGDSNWKRICKERSRDPEGVFPAKWSPGETIVYIGEYTFRTDSDLTTFRKVVNDKDFKDFL